MELADLTAYAKEKYDITEEYKWSSCPGISVLCHPVSKKWIALLMRQWDTETGTTIEKCDLRCGRKFLNQFSYNFLTEPTRENSKEWLGIDFDSKTNKQIVFALFDYAYQTNTPSIDNSYTITIDNQISNSQKVFTDTPIQFANRTPRPKASETPKNIFEMQRLYEYVFSTELLENKKNNFYRQGIFMEDYEDDVPWETNFTSYYPTYHDMNVKELRAYFTWRTKYRKGMVQPTAISFAYVYIYELLNQIGTSSTEESLRQMQQFYTNFIEAGYGDERMKKNLMQWIVFFCIINNLPAETACKYFNAKQLDQDLTIATLENPDNADADHLLSAWTKLAKKKILNTAHAKRIGDKYINLYAAILRHLLNTIRPRIIGKKTTKIIYPFNNAIYYEAGDCTERIYTLNPVRRYIFTGETWYEEFYTILPQHKLAIKNIATAIDIKLKAYLNISKSQDTSEATHIYDHEINNAIHEYEESVRPNIDINLSSLSQIREDSASTRDSLLTDEDKDFNINNLTATNTSIEESEEPEPLSTDDSPIEMQILRAILTTNDASAILKTHHLMPTVIAEKINEMYYDQFADNIVDCDGSNIWVVEDYKEELEDFIFAYRKKTLFL